MFTRKLAVFSIFIITCALGGTLAILHQQITEWFYPSFTKDEAMKMVGHRVTNIYGTEYYAGVKCPQEGGRCERVKVGERGTVINIYEVSPDEYMFVVRWDDPQEEPMLSYFGRESQRIFLSEQ